MCVPPAAVTFSTRSAGARFSQPRGSDFTGRMAGRKPPEGPEGANALSRPTRPPQRSWRSVRSVMPLGTS